MLKVIPFVFVAMGASLVFLALVDTFQTIILPRTVHGRVRLTQVLFRLAWRPWRKIALRLPTESKDSWLAIFGPVSLIILIGIWTLFEIVGFALIHWGIETPMTGYPVMEFSQYLFYSGGAFFTIGSEFVPTTDLGHLVGIAESGLGLGSLAIVISYIPLLAQSFAQREVQITLLDARAGSPPSAAALISRYCEQDDMEGLIELLKVWEVWSAELLQAYVSYPVLAMYRSQHERQSWLNSITTIMDVCSVVQLTQGEEKWAYRLRQQAQLTFAISRHACVDLALIYNIQPSPPPFDRLDSTKFALMRDRLAGQKISLCNYDEVEDDLRTQRVTYEGYVYSLGSFLLLDVPEWVSVEPPSHNWDSAMDEGHDHFTARR